MKRILFVIAAFAVTGLAHPATVFAAPALKTLTLKGTVNIAATDIAVRGHYVYAILSDRVDVVDVTNPSVPRIVSDFHNDISPSRIYLHGTYAYILSGKDIFILDISNPKAIAYTGIFTISGPDWLRDMAFRGNYGYVASGSSGLTVLNLTDPTYPKNVKTIPTSTIARNVTIDGANLYVAAEKVNTAPGSLYIFSLANPAQPKLLKRVTGNGVFSDVLVNGQYAYVALGLKGIAVYNISKPATPVFVRSAIFSGGINRFYDTTHFVFYHEYGGQNIRKLNVAATSRPIIAGTFQPMPGKAMTVEGDYLYLAATDMYGNSLGLKVYKIS